MLALFMLTCLNLAHVFETEVDGRWPTPRPFLPIARVNQVTNDTFGYKNPLGIGFGTLDAVAGSMFDSPTSLVNQWHQGSFENPPGAILDFITMTRFEVSVRVDSPLGLSINDTAVLERGQTRSGAAGVFQTTPENVTELDNRCVYRDLFGNAVETFRHPSWSLLCDSQSFRGFDSSDWLVSFGDYQEFQSNDGVSRSLSVRWTLTDVVSYHAGLQRWRAPVNILVNSVEVPSETTPVDQWNVWWFEASGDLFDAESIGLAAFSELEPLPPNFRPFPTPPEIRFTPLEFVEDFLPFERP